METNFLRRMQMRVALNRLDAKLKGAMTSLGFSLLSYLEDMGSVAEQLPGIRADESDRRHVQPYDIPAYTKRRQKSDPLGVDDLAWLQLLKIQAI
jgi:hypothetical protein